MEQNSKLKLFISYSHEDNREESSHIEQFKRHLAPLKRNELIEDWYDREIFPGEDFQDKIDNNLEDADIICLFISAYFLSSDNCDKEKKKALQLVKKKGISAIPIILSPCGWLDDKDISNLLALPIDGEPVSKFPNVDAAWLEVYKELKKVIEKQIKIKQLRITKEFEKFLQDTEMLTKAHSQKERVFLDDIFIYSELDKYDYLREYEQKVSSEELSKNLLDYSKILIAGEDQSGKTTLCKTIFKELRKKNFVPVYVSDKNNQFRGKIENKILQSFNKQYEGVGIDEISNERIVPIIDDFYPAKNKEKHLKYLSRYPKCIVVVDDIFGLNIRDEKLIRSFTHFKIQEFKPSLRYELIRKWISLSDKEKGTNYVENDLYQNIDKTTELIDTTLGKVIGSGIMPAYPFFILSVVIAYETFAKPLDQEITSQGYCYQALIYFHLRKQRVRNDEVDTYMNFLTELAFYLYKGKKYELSNSDFSSFMNSYLEKYNLLVEEETLLKNLKQIQIISVDSFNNYSFRYLYLYYFFVAKYLAENIESNKEIIAHIINNLHINENAYITIFLAYHSKNIQILDDLMRNALRLFDKYQPAILTKDELKFFDEQANIIVKAVLPPTNTTAEIERAKRLKTQDELEQVKQDTERNDEIKGDDFEIELRRAIKTVEVMGRVIKNRAGSLEKTKLKKIFKEAMNVHLRILSSFLEIIRDESEQKAITDFILERLNKIIEDKRKKPSKEKLEKISRTIFWNINFSVVCGIINKIVHSLGSDKLTNIVEEVCDKANTSATFLVKHGILMWYDKNLQIDNIEKTVNEGNLSEIAKRTMEFMITNHCFMHSVKYGDRQKIEAKLGIPSKKFLMKKSPRI